LTRTIARLELVADEVAGDPLSRQPGKQQRGGEQQRDRDK
jgi:hypothetical protein